MSQPGLAQTCISLYLVAHVNCPQCLLPSFSSQGKWRQPESRGPELSRNSEADKQDPHGPPQQKVSKHQASVEVVYAANKDDVHAKVPPVIWSPGLR
jgi:hypothetical protein